MFPHMEKKNTPVADVGMEAVPQVALVHAEDEIEAGEILLGHLEDGRENQATEL